TQPISLFNATLVNEAMVDAIKKLHPRNQIRNPVMFVVYVGSILTTLLWIQALRGLGEAPAGFILGIAAWLWFTVLFANFAEAIAEGRSKAQAEALRSSRKSIMAKKLVDGDDAGTPLSSADGASDGAARNPSPRHGSSIVQTPSTSLRIGDVVLVEAGD